MIVEGTPNRTRHKMKIDQIENRGKRGREREREREKTFKVCIITSIPSIGK